MNKPIDASILFDPYGSEHQFKRKVLTEINEIEHHVPLYCGWITGKNTDRNNALRIHAIRNNDISIEDLFIGGRRKAFLTLLQEIESEKVNTNNIAIVLGNKNISQRLIIAIEPKSTNIETLIGTPIIRTIITKSKSELNMFVGLWDIFRKNCLQQ